MNDNRPGRDLKLLLLGLGMLVVGLFIFTQSITVSTGFWASGIMLGRQVMPTGIVLVPLIIGVVLIVMFPHSIWPKILTGFGVLIIIAGIIMSVNIRLNNQSLFTFIVTLLLIFLGGALCLKILLSDKYDDRDKKK